MNNTLSNDIADRIRHRILDEEKYQPGERIPNERALAKELGVSRASIREGIRILVGNGLLKVRRGVGTFVAASPGLTHDPLGLSEIRDQYQLMVDWYQVRLMLEPAEMEIVAEKITDEQLEELYELEKTCSDAARSGRNYTEKDAAFHLKLAQVTENPILIRFMEGVTESVQFGTVLGGIDSRRNASQNHRRILESLEMRDTDGAYHAMRMHILLGQKVAEEQVRSMIREKEESAARKGEQTPAEDAAASPQAAMSAE